MQSSNPSVSYVADRLARRAEYIKLASEKQAFDVDGALSTAANFVKQKPVAMGLAGAGLGALAGAGSSLMSEEEDRQPWQSALTGGLAGGALGGGLGMMQQYAPKDVNKLTAEPGKPNIADAANKLQYSNMEYPATTAAVAKGAVPATAAYGIRKHIQNIGGYKETVKHPIAALKATGRAASRANSAAGNGLRNLFELGTSNPAPELRRGLKSQLAELAKTDPAKMTPTQSTEFAKLQKLVNRPDKGIRRLLNNAKPGGKWGRGNLADVFRTGKSKLKDAGKLKTRSKAGLIAALVGSGFLGAGGLESLAIRPGLHNRSVDNQAGKLLEQYAKAE